MQRLERRASKEGGIGIRGRAVYMACWFDDKADNAEGLSKNEDHGWAKL